MAYSLRIVPDVCAGAITAAVVIATSFKAPEPAVCLAQHGGRFENGQVGGYGLNYFAGQGCVVETIAEFFGFFSQF